MIPGVKECSFTPFLFNAIPLYNTNGIQIATSIQTAKQGETDGRQKKKISAKEYSGHQKN